MTSDTRVYRVTVATTAVVELRALDEDDAVRAVAKLCPSATVTGVEIKLPTACAGDKLAAVDARG